MISKTSGMLAVISAVVLAAMFGGISCATRGSGAGQVLTLAVDGQTRYQLVTPDTPTAVDRYTAQVLTGYLHQITGAAFPVVSPADMDTNRPSLFIGVSAPALARLGPDPLADLKDQEHVARSIGPDIALYGKGVHGNLYAVMEFLEDELGWRWYSLFESPVLPSRATLTLKPFNRKKGFSFAYRQVSVRRGMDYYYQQGINQGFDLNIKRMARSGTTNLDCFVSALPDAESGVHSLFYYIPPEPGAGAGGDRYDWVGRSNYFETNPEYFSMDKSGQRVKKRQLCFSDPGLRQELTKNVLKHIAIAGDRCLLAVSAQDCTGPFCYCKACKALEEQYQSPGGPIYDYLIELCGMLKVKHPGVWIKTLAYRRAQTQKPPVLAAGARLPDNLVVDFAPIEDNYFADWTHPDEKIQETYRDLQAWGKITTHLWAWIYPNPMGSGAVMPVGNIERVIRNVRLAHLAGVEGMFPDHRGEKSGFGEIQAYLFYKLWKDVNCDTDALIKEFTDNFYGPAAADMRLYWAELEAGRKAMTNLPPGVSYKSANTDDRTFPYLTAANIHRWQKLFDRMERAVADQPERIRVNVRFVRRELDFATLWKWFELKKAYPDYYTDYRAPVGRIEAVNRAKPLPLPEWDTTVRGRTTPALGESTLESFVTMIELGGQCKPLPQELAGIEPDRIRQYVPKYPPRRAGKKIILDPAAAFGYAAPVSRPDVPFNFGYASFYDGVPSPKKALKREEIIPGGYNLYKLGMITISPAPESFIWFSARGTETNLRVGDRLYEPGADNEWEVYVSIKFLGPSYGQELCEKLLSLADREAYEGMAAGDMVLVDRIILVSKSADQFKKP